MRFDEVAIRLSELDAWATSSGFDYQPHWDDEGKSITRLDVSYTPPGTVKVALDDKTELSIAWQWTWSGMSQVTTETRLGPAASFRVAFADQGDLGPCLEYVFRLRNFLSLAVGRPIQVLSVTGFHDPSEDEAGAHRLEVPLLYRLIGIQEEAGRGRLLGEMLFSLGDALARLEEIFRTWFARQEIFGPVFNRYFHNRHMAREIQFESYVRALETYHRRRTDATELPPEEHEARVKRFSPRFPAATSSCSRTAERRSSRLAWRPSRDRSRRCWRSW